MTMEFHFPLGKTAHIMYADDCFDPNLSSMLIEECVKNFQTLFAPGPTMGGVDSDIKCSMDMNFSAFALANMGLDTNVFGRAETEITRGLWSTLAYYRDEYSWLTRWPNIQDTGFRLQYYARNTGFYREHVDSQPWLNTFKEETKKRRVLAAVIYLNDVEVGGETFFADHDFLLPPRAGRIVLFPAEWTHPHGSRTPISHAKWMISTFITCEPNQQPEWRQDPQEEPKIEESQLTDPPKDSGEEVNHGPGSIPE